MSAIAYRQPLMLYKSNVELRHLRQVEKPKIRRRGGFSKIEQIGLQSLKRCLTSLNAEKCGERIQRR